MKPLIIFVTGASATGKTAVYEALKERNLDNVAVHDVDEDGVPEDRGHYWGMFRVEQLLYRAKENAKAGKHTVICGIAFPHDVVDGRYYESKLNVRYVLLTCNKATMKQRLKERLIEQGKKSGWIDLTASNQRVQAKMEKQTVCMINHLVFDTVEYDTNCIVDEILNLMRVGNVRR